MLKLAGIVAGHGRWGYIVVLEGCRVLITGGAGLIGSHLVDLLVAARVKEVVVLDNLSRGRARNLTTSLSSGRVRLIEGDIRDRGLVAPATEGIDLVFHLAAVRLTQCATEPRLALEVMADGAFNVFEASVAAGVAKVVAASSASVYGRAETYPTCERHHPYDNQTLYGAAKLFNEGMLRSFRDRHGLDYVALRPFNVYGPRMDIRGAYTEVLVRWMERIAAGRPPVIFGSSSQSMDLVYVEDAARAFLLASEANASDAVVNVASGVETTLNDLARALLRTMGSDLPIEYGPERNVSSIPRRLGDTRLATELIGFEAEVNLDTGLRRLVDWWRSESAVQPSAAGG